MMYKFIGESSLMIDVAIIIAGVVVAYFVGNISPAILLGKVYGVDVRKEGSGNAGTTNVLRTVGKKAGVITLIIDILKGFIVSFVAGLLVYGISFPMLCGIFVVIGHMWPIVFGFKGGKGVATTFGFILAVQPLLALILLLLVAIGVLITRRMSVGVICAALLAIPIGYFINHENIIWVSIVAILVIIKHKDNIKRIIAGKEPKMSIGNKDKKTK